jgi:hypothetical protein
VQPTQVGIDDTLEPIQLVICIAGLTAAVALAYAVIRAMV